MPSKSKKQQDFMAAVANNPKFAAETGVPQSVGKDYEKADKMKGMKKYQAGGMSQGYNARLDDSMGAKNGKKKQSMKSRRDESEGMEESMGKRKFAGDKAMKFQRGGPMPAGMANRRAGVNNREMPQFNLGCGNLRSSTLLKVLNEGKYDKVSEQIVRWDKAGGKVRGAGCATKGTRAAKMVTMKGS